MVTKQTVATTPLKKLLDIQTELKVNKNQLNKFGGYKYRSCEDILEALKPLLAKTGCTLSITDEVILIGDRYYIKATALLRDIDNGEIIEKSTALARESDTKKGMDESQITGTASSYARKYCLCGLFAIDDGIDADKTNTWKDEKVKDVKVAGDWLSKVKANTSFMEQCLDYNDFIKKVKSRCLDTGIIITSNDECELQKAYDKVMALSTDNLPFNG